MKVKVEIDMKPEELQRFLGMPDVGALREEVLRYIKERIASDPAGFVLENLEQLGRSRPLRRFLYGRQAAEGSGPRGRDDDAD
jgi:hypothetical protein